MRRNLRFWSRYTAECFGLILVFIAVMELLSVFFGYSFSGMSALFSELSILLNMSAALCLFLINSGMQGTYIPILLSHGETRKNVFLWQNATRLVVCLLAALLSLCFALAGGETDALRSLPTTALLLLTASSVGGIVGTLTVKYRWAGVALMAISCAIFGGLTGFISTSIGFADVTAAMQELLSVTPTWLIVTAAVLFACDLTFHWLIMRRREVRF